MRDPTGVLVPAKVVWTVVLFLALQTAGGLYYAGRILTQFEAAVATIAQVQAKQETQDQRIASNREALVKIGAVEPQIPEARR